MPSPDYSVDLDLGEPPPEVMEYARQHCGEDPNTRLQAIYELREMIYERGECTPQRMDDEFLIRFLRARKFIPQRAHRLLVNYCQFREEYPELVENIFPLDLRNIGDANVMAVPPYKDPVGRRLLFYRIGCWDPKVIPIEDLFKATILALEIGLLEQRCQILGAVAIFDLEDLGTAHAWQITPSVAAKMVKLLVSCFPVNTYAIHVVNQSWIFDKIFSIFKPLLNAEMRSKIYFHRNFSSLHKHIGPDHLPERYGGIWPDYSYNIWLNSLRKNFAVAQAVITHGYKFREPEVDSEVVRQLKEKERWNPQDVPLTDVFRGIQMGLEGAMAEPQTQICGIISVFDMKGLSFKHIMQFTPSYAKMILDWIQECVPIRVKAVHIINQPYIFNMLFAIFKPFMREKLRSRIHFHGTNMESLMQHVDPKVLRKRHGGLLPDPEINGEVLWQMLHHYEDSFKLANSYGYIKNANNNK